MAGHSQTSPQPHNDRCLLFELPRELRDLIYEHALTHEGGIIADVDTSKSQIHVRSRGRQGRPSTHACANPLMLVCHQLNRETEGVIFGANSDVTLYCVSYATPSSYTFNLFASQIGVAAFARLRKVTINGSPKVDARNVAPLTWKEVSSYFNSFNPFCISNPQITVVIRFRRVANIKGTSWLSESIALKEITRGPDAILEPAERVVWRTQQVLSSLGNTLPELQRLPANLRFSILEAVPESDIRKEAWGPITAKWVEAILPYAKQLWEDGI